MEQFFGSWKLDTNEGLNELLVRLGTGYISRKTLNATKPILIISRGSENGTFTIKSVSPLKSSSCNFRVGYAFDETTADGRSVRSVFTVDGNTLKQEQVGTKTTYVTYNIEGDLLKTVIKVEELTCFRNYKRTPTPHNGPPSLKSQDSCAVPPTPVEEAGEPPAAATTPPHP